MALDVAVLGGVAPGAAMIGTAIQASPVGVDWRPLQCLASLPLAVDCIRKRGREEGERTSMQIVGEGKK